MKKDRFYNQYSSIEINVGSAVMKAEMIGLDYKHIIRTLHMQAWQSFEAGEWKYDGATFVKERYSHTPFELASFIHDWRNSCGYVGAWVDQEFIEIMICLNYPFKIILWRWLLMRFTFLNVWIHRIKKNLKNTKPQIIYKL